ncbi:membrane-spanning 4-domains subfamily A member 13 isoform X2 [Tupaia chinensis]|uniref:membrane-spanning 4-domains subfamily A member 13 isoform X2 n=1 Tax=Tupaia chinensis TaxID=246437 RepID=UPI0003C8EE6E|nr:membrane-spanning 4-domains subfamily A member 13 isoform X2 [Tupaia chinensis]
MCGNAKISSADWLVLGFVISGVTILRTTKRPSRYSAICALTTNIFCTIITLIALTLTIIELSTFHTVSYRNYGQAKLGREVSRIFLFSYPLEFCIALVYSIINCRHMGERQEENLTSISEEVETAL